jgi:sec-independent protein translocase protein TatC
VDDRRLPLTDHLRELRTRIFRVLITWVIASALAWSFSEAIFGLLMEPAVTALGDRPLQAIAPTEIFFTYLKSAVLAGFVLGLPVIFWQLWAFVSPGLYDTEKTAILPFVLVSTLLFAGGATFGYAVVFPLMFEFLTGFDSDFVQSAWTMREVFALTTRLFLAFGVAFELPVLVFFLSVAGIHRGHPHAARLGEPDLPRPPDGGALPPRRRRRLPLRRRPQTRNHRNRTKRSLVASLP